MERLQKYGLCLVPNREYPLLDEIGEHHLDQAVDLIKNGNTFVIVMDNIDWEVRVHDARENTQNKSVHAVAASIVFDRVSSSHLSDVAPHQDLIVLNNENVTVPTLDKMNETRLRYKFLVARIISEYLTPF